MKYAPLLILLLLPCRLYAGCIGAAPVINTTVSVGKETILKAGAQPFYIMNGGNTAISVKIAPIAADPALLMKGYEQAPSTMKFIVFDSQVLLQPAEVKNVSAGHHVPALGASLLGPEAERIVGLSEETTCYVSTRYFE